jgi:prepilin-type N-terminal cleavage/methylation domain-containing protein
MRRTERGFTLMELMVVIVIVAILAAVAVPLYINYVKDAQRTEAKGAIGAIITGEQAYYQKAVANGGGATFTSDFTQLNVDLTDLATKWTLPPTISGVSATGFTVKLTSATDATMWVQCVYTRGGSPAWTEQ